MNSNDSPRPCIIWATARTGSTTLSRALGAVSEPFKDHANWTVKFAGPVQIIRFCATRCSLKHLYGEGPEEVDLALAHASNRHGYRHIHLVRRNELARLVSYDIAVQKVAWRPDTSAAKYSDLKSGKSTLRPLDIPNLLHMHRQAMDRWRKLGPEIGAFLTVRFEDITNANCCIRRTALHRIAAYLGIRSIAGLDRRMFAGGQRTREVWEFVPNLSELRQALVASELKR